MNGGIVKLPSRDNAILIMWDDSLENGRIELTPYLWDMLKCLAKEEQAFEFSRVGDNHKLTVTVEMEILTPTRDK